MKLSRRANTIILWFVSIGLLAGMVITFTPTLGLGFGGSSAGAVQLTVNGQPIHELQVAQTRANNPLYFAVREGEAAADLELLLIDDLIRNAVLSQESARQRVTDAEIRRAVEDFRSDRGIAGRANDSAYLNLLSRSGFTDESFRASLRVQLQQEKWESSLIGSVEVSDLEVETYFLGNRDRYLSEERIAARHIVTNDAESAALAAERLEAGESAAQVARELSVERADRDGALGAAVGETEPRPVGRAALPTAVSNAAFALRGPGTTGVVEADGRFHLVVVESYLPALPRPFDEVAPRVRDDALAAKQFGVLDAEIERLVASARVEFPASSTLNYVNPVVARVGSVEIMASDWVRATYTNPQIQQALSPDTAFIVTAFFKPAVLDQLIDQQLALLGAKELERPFVGPNDLIAQSILNYVARDAAVDAADVAQYYQENRSDFVTPASAVVVEVESERLSDAIEARALLTGGAELDDPRLLAVASVVDRGSVMVGMLAPLVDTTLFATDAFEPLPDSPWEISDILVLDRDEAPSELPSDLEVAPEPEASPLTLDPITLMGGDGSQRYLLVVAQRTPERTRTLTEVQAQIEAILLSEARSNLREAYLSALRSLHPVENLAAAAIDDGFSFEIDVPDEEESESGDSD